jgi:type III pantothenate kinase
VYDSNWYQPVAASAKRAAQDAMNGWDPSGGALYYYNPAKTSNAWMLSRTVIKVIGKQPLVVGPGLKTGLNIHVDIPSQVGADRIVAAVAALAEYKAPLVLIDMGTATTVEVVEPENVYMGGVIFPGVMVSLDSLTSRAAQLPGISLDRPKNVIGRNTVDCMRSGVMYGTAAMLDGLIDRIAEELGHSSTIIATGGIAQFIVPLCRHEIILEKELLLKGLNVLYKKNRK